MQVAPFAPLASVIVDDGHHYHSDGPNDTVAELRYLRDRAFPSTLYTGDATDIHAAYTAAKDVIDTRRSRFQRFAESAENGGVCRGGGG